MKDCIKHKVFKPDASLLILHCQRITEEYQNDGYQLTVRQLYYQMVDVE